MSSLNFRLYADQIYGLACSKLKDIITPEIEKDKFTAMFKEGQVKYDNIQNKHKISVNPQISINNLQIEQICLNIPNETENFGMKLSGIKITIELLEINEEEIEKLIIEKRKTLIEKFIAFAVKKIENKEESKSFIEGLMESMINRAINGLKIELNNIELTIKYKNSNFILFIEKIAYSEENGIQINNYELSCVVDENNSENTRYDIIKKFNIEIAIIKPPEKEKQPGETGESGKSEDNNNNNQINIKLSDFQFNLNKNVFLAINELLNFIEKTKYKYIYLRYKKLIQYYKPQKPNLEPASENEKENENKSNNNNEIKNQYYKSLWLYAIKTVIKLQKYVGYDKLYLLDLPEYIQAKISKKYVDDNNYLEKLIFPTEINLLKATKEKVEKKVLEGKKGNALTSAFSFFFGGGKKNDEEKKELSAEEKKIFDNIYTEEYLIKYLYGKAEDSKTKSNPIKDKISLFFSNIKINVNFNKIELILGNDVVGRCTLYISDIKIGVEKANKEIKSVLTIGNIGSNLDKELFSERININKDMDNNSNDLIMVTKDKNNKIKVDLGFKNIELSDDLCNFMLIYFSSLKNKKKVRIFRNMDYQEIIDNQEQKEESKENTGFLNNFSISHIPSLMINNNGNKTIFSVVNYSMTPSKIEVVYNIKDSFGTIVDNYTFILNREEKTNKYILNLEQPLRISISSESSKLLFISLLKLKEKIKQIKERELKHSDDQKIDNIDTGADIDVNNENLYGFTYIKHKKLDLKNVKINELTIEIIIEKIIIEIYENTVKSKFSIKNINLSYEHKKLFLKIGKISANTNLMSTMIIYLAGYKGPNFNQFQQYIDEVKKEYENQEKINDIGLLEKEEEEEGKKKRKKGGKIKYDLNLDYFLDGFKIYINLLLFSFQVNGNIISYSFNKIRVQKVEKNIMVKLSNFSLSFKDGGNEKNSKIMKILNLEEEACINIDPKKKLSIVKLSHPKVNINLEKIEKIKKNYNYYLEQIEIEPIKSKIDLQVQNIIVKVNNDFNISISEILLKNYDDENIEPLYLTINNFLIKNKKNEFITRQKQLKINMIPKLIKEYSISVNFSDISVNLSKKDISNLSKMLAEKEKEKEKEEPKERRIIIDNNDLNLKKKPSSFQQKLKKDLNININCNIPKIDLSLCTEKRYKKIQMILSPLISNTKLLIPKNYKTPKEIHKNIEVTLGKINLIFNDENTDENYYIMEYRGKEDYGYDFGEKSIINFEPNLDKQNQIVINISDEIKNDVNNIEMNINKIGINLKVNILINLLLFIKDIMPKKNLYKKSSEKKFDEEKAKRDKEINCNINFNEIQFKFEPINNNIGEINLNINKIEYLFNSIENLPLPDGVFELKLNQILVALNDFVEINKIINTKKDFILVKGNIKDDSSDIKINMGEMMMNLSFTDINLIKDFISSSGSFYKKNKEKILLLEKEIEKEKEEKKIIDNSNVTNKPISLNYDMKSFDFTLIDNYSNNYQPLLNIKLNNLCFFLSEKKTVNASLYLTMLTYNYISSIWEPLLERSCIQLMLMQKEDNNSTVNSFKVEIYQLLLNISDMFISSMGLSMKNLSKIMDTNKTIAQINDMNTSKSEYSSSVNSIFSSTMNEIDAPPQKKPTNNRIINYTGKEIKIIFNNKSYVCGCSSEIDLEYINKWDNYKNENSKIKIYYDNNNIIEIPFKKLGIDYYKFSNGQFLVWENTISLSRQINLNLYSKIILKNKTNYNFSIKVMNKDLGNLFILLKPNSKSGIPLAYCNPNTFFNLKLILNEIIINDKAFDQNNIIKLNDIINLPEKQNYQKKIIFEDKVLLLKLQRKIDNVSTLLITSQYSIVNCLPCDILLETNLRKIKIKKCSQFPIDFDSDSQLIIKLIIKTLTDTYLSEPIQLSSLVKKYDSNESNNLNINNKIIFRNQKREKESFNLSFLLKNKDYHNSLIIYSEYLLFNDSGIDFKFYSDLFYNISDNIYLISNKIDLDGSNFQIGKNKYISQFINLKEIVKSVPYYLLDLNNGNGNYNLTLSIRKKLSFISIRNNPNFRENIMSMIFEILPSCKIINLISNKKLLLRDYKDNEQSMIVPALTETNFNFFNKTKNDAVLELGLINASENQCNETIIFNSFKNGIYTFMLENNFFNLEIKESISEGILNVFVTEANLENAKAIIINKTKINFEVYQNKYEKHRQIINENNSHILKIYDHNNIVFYVEIGGKSYACNFTPFKESYNVYPIENQFILVNESNGVRIKIILYMKEEYEKLIKKEKNLYGNILINNCYISFIRDNYNKDRKLRNYERNEILLFYFQNLNTTLLVNKSKEPTHKKNLSVNVNLGKMEIFNQLSKKGKYSCIFKNTLLPCMNFVEEMDLYNEDKVAKINKFTFYMNKLKLNIDPGFILEIINFVENITYRLGKINFNVDKIFLRTNKNIRDITIKKNIEKYKKNQNLICYGSEFNFPSINIDFELTEVNLDKLLHERVGLPGVVSWIIFGLAGQNQNIFLQKFTLNNYYGEFAGLIKKVKDNYKSQMMSVALNIGFMGVLGQIKQLFIQEKTDENSIDVQKNRIRYPRAFYGKYHYIKNYNEEEAKIIEQIIFLYKRDFKDIYCENLLLSQNKIFYFSCSSLFIFKKNLELLYKIDYKTIDNAYNENENVIIKYKKENDEENPSSIINCDEIHVAKELVKYFNNFVDIK